MENLYKKMILSLLLAFSAMLIPVNANGGSGPVNNKTKEQPSFTDEKSPPE